MLQFDYFFLKVKGDICYVFEEYTSQTRKGAVYKNDKTDESKSRGGEERRKVIKKQQLIQFLKDLWNVYTILEHSHKKQKDSLDGSLDRVLFAAELKISKILVLRLQFIKCKQWMCRNISLFYYSDINLVLIMPAVNYVMYGCSSLRITPGLITI